MQAVYQPHPSPTRDTAAEQGVGTARREEPNMLPRTNTRVVLGGRTQIGWKQSAARENKGGVLPASKPAAVVAKSANNDPQAVGVPGFAWGIASDDAPSTQASGGGMLVTLGLLGLVGFLLARK